jgi:hypothetical protein
MACAASPAMAGTAIFHTECAPESKEHAAKPARCTERIWYAGVVLKYGRWAAVTSTLSGPQPLS